MNPENQEKHGSATDRANDLINKARSVKKARQRLRIAWQTARIAYSATTSVLSGPVGIVVLTLVIVSLSTFLLVLGGGPISAGTPEDPGGDETCADIGGACKAGCAADEDENSASCQTTGDKCCVRQQTCADIGGACRTTATGCQSDERANDSATCQQASDTCCTQKGQNNFPKCSNLDTNPQKCLLDDFNAVVRNYTSQNQIKTIYLLFWKNGQSALWRNLIKNKTTYEVRLTYGQRFSHGSTNYILLNDFFTRSDDAQRYLFTHETGHSIRWRNSQLFKRFDINRLANQDGTACYQYNSGRLGSGDFMKSYVLRYYCKGVNYSGISHDSESFAEAIANYLRGSSSSWNVSSSTISGSKYCAIRIGSISNNCRNTYQWIKNNVFDGYEF